MTISLTIKWFSINFHLNYFQFPLLDPKNNLVHIISGSASVAVTSSSSVELLELVFCYADLVNIVPLLSDNKTST